MGYIWLHNPLHVNLEVHATGFNGVYSHLSVHKSTGPEMVAMEKTITWLIAQMLITD